MIRPGKKLSTKLYFLVNKFRKAGSLLLPPSHCMFCDSKIASHTIACEPCREDLEWNDCSCYRCGEPFARSMRLPAFTLLCPACLASPSAIHRTVAPLRYAFPIDCCLQELKYQHRRYRAAQLITLTKQSLEDAYAEDSWPEYLIPVPLYRKDERRRGYNQAHLLAKKLSTQLALPVESHLLGKQIRTQSQTRFDRQARQRNLKHAFVWQAKHAFEAQHVALVDDVMTTGATLHTLAQLLVNKGVKRVDAWSIARTPKQQAL